jgi:hypothetical protein
MSIAPFLEGKHFDAETTRVMGIAFQLACIALHTPDDDDPVLPRVANKIIELVKTGERDPDLLCEHVLTHLHEHPPH